MRCNTNSSRYVGPSRVPASAIEFAESTVLVLLGDTSTTGAGDTRGFSATTEIAAAAPHLDTIAFLRACTVRSSQLALPRELNAPARVAVPPRELLRAHAACGDGGVRGPACIERNNRTAERGSVAERAGVGVGKEGPGAQPTWGGQ